MAIHPLLIISQSINKNECGHLGTNYLMIVLLLLLLSILVTTINLISSGNQVTLAT